MMIIWQERAPCPSLQSTTNDSSKIIYYIIKEITAAL
jgi:hypothetical protein